VNVVTTHHISDQHSPVAQPAHLLLEQHGSYTNLNADMDGTREALPVTLMDF
jgi:hypothetical protein